MEAPRPTRADDVPSPDGDLYAGTAGSEGAREDWSARYGAPPPPPPQSTLDFSGLFVLLDVLRRAAPAELQGRLTSLIREALLTLRSLIDWYLERLEHKPREPRVEDIPID
jgi:hypothetical protein